MRGLPLAALVVLMVVSSGAMGLAAVGHSGFPSEERSAQPSQTDPNLTAVISATPSIGVTPVTVVFNGSERGGTLPPYAYRWTFGEGGTANGSSFSHTFGAPGGYPVTLTVTDRANNSANATVVIQVEGPLSVSVGFVFLNATATCPGAPANLTGPLQVVLTAVPVGGVPPLTYSWQLGGGARATGPTVVRNFTGAFLANLTVTDAQGHTANVSQPVPSPTFTLPWCPARSTAPGASLAVSLAVVGLVAAVAVVGIVVAALRRESG